MISACDGRYIRSLTTVCDDILGWTRWSLWAFGSKGQWERILVWVFLLAIFKPVSNLLEL